MAASDKFMKVGKPRRDAGDNSNVNPINGPIAKSANPNVPGAGNNPGSSYTRAGGTALTDSQVQANRHQVRKEKSEASWDAYIAKVKKESAAYYKKHQDEQDKKANKQIKPAKH